MVVTRPGFSTQRAVWLVLLVSSLCIVGDAVWCTFGQPKTLIEPFSKHRTVLAGLWTVTIVIQLVAFALIARQGLSLATSVVRLGNPGTPESPIRENLYTK
jgi:hypothetical protein